MILGGTTARAWFSASASELYGSSPARLRAVLLLRVQYTDSAYVASIQGSAEQGRQPGVMAAPKYQCTAFSAT